MGFFTYEMAFTVANQEFVFQYPEYEDRDFVISSAVRFIINNTTMVKYYSIVKGLMSRNKTYGCKEGQWGNGIWRDLAVEMMLLYGSKAFWSFFPYLVWVFLCIILFWELRDNGVVKNLQFLTLKPRSHLRILIYRTWAIDQYNFLTFTIVLSKDYQHARLIGRQQNLERTGSDQPL